MALTTGQKVGIVAGGILLAAGIGFAIYYATRKSATSSAQSPGGSNLGTGNAVTNPNPKKEESKKKLSLAQILEIIAKINQYTQESFPLKPGMKGSNVLAMQNALRAKFNQLNVGTDGLFGLKTLMALNEIGYTTYLVQSISKVNFDRIIEGKYPS